MDTGTRRFLTDVISSKISHFYEYIFLIVRFQEIFYTLYVMKVCPHDLEALGFKEALGRYATISQPRGKT
jgi:hypothetical protein